MAYGLKYSASAYGLSPTQWKVEIYEKDFSPIEGSLPISLLLVGDGLKIGYDREEDRFNVIYSRYAIIDIKVTGSFDLDTLQFDDERKFLIKIYRGATHEFSGWIIPNYSSQAYEDVSITTITIQAKDSINRLRDIPFVDEYPILFSHKQSVKSLLSQALRNIGYNLDLDIYYNKYEDGMLKTASDCPLSQLFVNVRSFKENDVWISYYDVIERLLSDHDLRIFQANGRWVVLSPIEVVDGSISGRRFNYLGEQQSNISLTSNISIGGSGLGIKKSSIIRKGIPIQSFVANFEFGQSRNLVLNGGMENFSDFQPEGWTLSNNWVNGEVAENTGGGIIFRDTYATRSPSILPDVPVNDASLNQNKYLESNQINIERLGTFSLSAETFISEGIDAARVRVEFYNEGGANKQYITSDGKLTFVPTSIYVYNAGTDAYKLLTLTWENKNQYGTPVGFKYMKISVYEGIRLRSGTPSTTEVKFKNVSISGRPIDVSGNFTGKRVEIKNSELPNSKKYDDVVFYYKDVELFNEPEHVHKLYLNNEIGEEGISTGKWKRISESIKRKLVESRLVDRLSMTNRFGDIFEGSIYGYIGMSNTPYLELDGKRLLVLYSEFSLGTNTSEVVAIELFANNFTLAQKEYNLFSDNTIVEVDTESSSTTKVNVGEKFEPITNAGGTTYGGLYIDYGIDSLPINSTDPRATNKGVLVLGPVNAQKIELGNAANQTLVEILGRLGIRTASNYLAEFSTAELTANRVATLPDRNIIVNDYDYIVNKPDLGESWETNWLLKNNEQNLFIGNGEDAISVILGKAASVIIAKGSFRLGSADEGNLIFSVPSLNDDVTVSFPSFGIAVNDWNSLYNKPTSFTPSAHFHQIGDVEGLPTALGNKQDLNPILTALTGLTGNGIVRKTGTSSFVIGTNDVITLSGDVTGTGTTAITTTLANSGVTAGTYRSVTVDVKGRVTNGSNPTTVLGYGITDLGDYWTTYWNTTKAAYVSFGASVEIAQNLTVNQDLYVYGVLYDTTLSSGSNNQFLRSNGAGGFFWTSLSTAQISNFSTNVLGQVLTDYAKGSNTNLSPSDTILSAFGKLEGKVDDKANALSGTTNYLPKFTSSTAIGNSTIYDNGTSVGIGTASPQSSLHVNGQFTAGVGLIGKPNNIQIISSLSPYSGKILFGTDGTGWKFAIGKNQNDVISDLLTIQDNGNIGIGTASPNSKMDVAGNINISSGSAYLQNNIVSMARSGGYNQLMDNDGNTAFFIGTSDPSTYYNNTNHYFRNKDGSTYYLNITGTNAVFNVIPSCSISPTLGSHLVNLATVQSLVSAGFSVSTVCVLAFNTNQSLSGAKTQGGYTTITNDYALFAGQTTASENGVRKYNGSTWVRPTENDSDSEIRGKGHLITNGTFIGTQWVNNNASTITVDTTSITYAQWSVGEPIFTNHVAYGITSTKISNWDTAFSWGNHASGGYVKNTGDETIAGIKTFSSELRGVDLRYSGTLKPSGYSPTSAGMVLMSASTTTNYWKSLVISDITGLQTALDAKPNTDANLVAISALNTNGFIKRTGAGTYAIDANTYLNITGGTMTGALNLVNSVRVGGTGVNDDNTYLGKNTLISRTSGTGNSGLGASSLGALTTGSNNTGLGRNAGSSLTTGAYNLFLGSNVGSGITTGSNNIIIGGQVTGLSSSLANNIIIADGAGNRRINVGSTGLVGFGLNTAAYRVDVSGDVNVTGMYRLNGSFGADHQFLKSNGTTQEWATLNVGEISDIATTYLSISSAADYAFKADAVLYGTFEGERGFKLFHDTAKTDTAALFFANQDTGTVGIHYYGLDSNDAVTQHGIQISGDGFVYHKTIGGPKYRFLTTNDNIGGGIWNGGTVSNPIILTNFSGLNFQYPNFPSLASIGTYQVSTQTDPYLRIKSQKGIGVEATTALNLSGSEVAINNLVFDTSNASSLVGQNAKFSITQIGFGRYKATLVSA